jgi:response regulator RpfG family c-di-GMP phosphodiesterase
VYKVLLAEDEEDIRDILATMIESEFDCEIIQVPSGNKAVEALEKDEDIIAIISDYSMADGNGGLVYNYNKKHKNLPFVMVSGGFLEDYPGLDDIFQINDKNKYVNKPVNFDKFLTDLRPIFSKQEESSDYCRVKLWFIEKFPPVDFAVYLKLGDGKFVKIKNDNDDNFEEVTRYKDKTDNTFFLKTCDFSNYMKKLISEFHLSLESTGKPDNIEMCGYTLEILSDTLSFLGVSPLQMEVVNKTVESCLSALVQDKSIKNELKVFLEGQGYFVSHAVTAIHIACMLSKELSMGEEKTIKKIAFAGILHDLGLKSLTRYSHIMKLDHVDYIDLPQAQKTCIREHTHEAVKLFENYALVPDDSLTMIREHHEYPDGSGFPKGVKEAQMSILSIVFSMSIVIADHFFYKGNSTDSLNLLVKKLTSLGFDQGKSKRVFDIFKSKANA